MATQSKQIEFYFDFGSPTSYLAYRRLPGLAERSGAPIVWRPILLGAVHQATGNSSPVLVPAKARYMVVDLDRFACKHGISFRQNPHFPLNTLALMRGAVAYQEEEAFPAFLESIFTAMWSDPRNLGDANVLADVLGKAGFDPEDFQDKISSSTTKEALKVATGEAVARGVFGAPTFFVDEEMFFGQDRLDWVEEALAASQ